MSEVLPRESVERYRRDGFPFPIRVLSTAEARQYRSRLESVECEQGGPLRGELWPQLLLRPRRAHSVRGLHPHPASGPSAGRWLPPLPQRPGGSTRFGRVLAREYLEGRLKLDEFITQRLSLEQINDGFAGMAEGAVVRAPVLLNN